MSNSYTTPVLNLNGSNGKDLYEELKTASDQLQKAREAVASVTVHGRDFQTQPDGTWIKAFSQKNAALFHLDDANEWIEANLNSVRDQLSVRGDI
jgi:hypothetical protein